MTKKIKKLLSSYRLIASYFLLFVTSTLCLFALSILMLDTYLTSMEHERVEERIESYKAIYQSKGFNTLLQKIRNQHQINKFSNIYIHITDKKGKTIWLTVPEELNELPSNYFTPPEPTQNNRWYRIDLPIENDLDILIQKFPDGTTLQVGRTTERQEFIVEGLRDVFIITFSGIIVLGFIGGVMFSRHVLRPVRQLTATVTKVSSGEIQSRVRVLEDSGELKELAELFNQMLERIEILITAMRDALGNVSHDLKTPLARMKARIEQTLISDTSPETQREALMDCAEEVDRIDKLINMLMDIAEAETGQMHLSTEIISCSEIIDDVIDLYEMIAEEKNISIINFSKPLKINTDRQRTLQVIANLTDNALKYTPEGGTITYRTEISEKYIKISIEDTGPGIPKGERKRIFEKLYRLDKSRSTKGLGLGLSLVRAVVEAHKGRILIHDAPEGGTIFEVFLPRV